MRSAPLEAPVRIGLVAGEMSGDLLGADLIPCLQRHFPGARFAGIGGERMIARGFDSLFPMERLSVMGFVDPLKRLPELLRIRRALYRHFAGGGYDLVMGIDAPDFNLGLELKLRRRGILTAHYVSPSVWAWRQGRVRKIARAVDRMLTLLPFEADFYRRHQVPVSFVGHPLADSLTMEVDTDGARRSLGLDPGPVLAVMPGSRRGEVEQMCRLYLDAAAVLQRETPGLQVVIPAASQQRQVEIQQILADYPALNVQLVSGQSHLVMSAADAVMLTSGTTALEAMLLKKPMVVAYRMGSGSYWLASRLVKTPYISLPNLIAGKRLVPELIQHDATVAGLVAETRTLLFDDDRRARLTTEFRELHTRLRLNASEGAADVLAGMIGERRGGGSDRAG